MTAVAGNQNRVAYIEKLEQFAIMGILFFIPSSPAAPNLLGVLLIFLWLFRGNYTERLYKLKENPLFWAFLGYLIIWPLSLLWSSNADWGSHMVERHAIYLMFPFILMAAKYENIKYYISAYIAGITLTEFVSYAVWFGIISLDGVSAEDPTPFYIHVEYNPMLAWGLYLVMYGLLFNSYNLKWKIFLSIFAATMTINMFITGGRGGQLDYFFIIAILFVQYFYHKGKLIKGFIVGGVFIFLVSTLAYQKSPLFQERIDLAINELKNYTPQSHGSVSYRLHMYINTWKMSWDRPWDEVLLGSGVGDFPEDYTKYVGPNAPFKMVAGKSGHSHPHNQFMYQLGALGVLGLLSWLALWFGLIYQALRIRDGYTYYRWGFIGFLFVAQLTDTLLLTHPIGLLFIAFSAVLFIKEPLKK